MINWWFNDEFKNPTISGYELHQIPIKHNKQTEKEISKLVTTIVENNKTGKDIKNIITQINQLVYQLYFLNEEVIKTIENKITH